MEAISKSKAISKLTSQEVRMPKISSSHRRISIGSRNKRIQNVRSIIASGETKKPFKILGYDSNGEVLSVKDIPRNINLKTNEFLLDLVKNNKKITSFIVAHNKKNGSVVPEEVDDILMSSFKKAGRQMGVKMMDYFIISNDAVFSRYKIDV